jgi:dienelactone hydrolase
MLSAAVAKRLKFAIAGLAVAAWQSGCAHSEPRPLTVDDMMKVGGLGRASVDPSGRWAVFEKLRPYEEARDFSFRTYAFGKSGHQLWRLDLAAGTPPERLPGIDPEPHSYLLDFSDSGEFLSVMQYHDGDLRVGAYDMQVEKVTYFRPVPAFSRMGDHNPVWVSDTELVYAALPEGEWPLATSVRAFTGKTLARRWQEAWRGQLPTATEARSTLTDRSDEIEAGSLVRANARTGRVDVLADGLFADVRVSANRQRLAALSVSLPRPTDAAQRVTYDARRYRLRVFDLLTGESQAMANGLEFFPYSLAWSPDNHRLAAFGWANEDSPAEGRFHVVDTSTGDVTRYDHKGLDLASERERGSMQRPERVMFLGDALVVFARTIPDGSDQAPRFTARERKETSLPPAHWYSVWPDGRSEILTAGLEGVSPLPLGAGAGHVTIAARDGVYRIFEGGRRERLTPAQVTDLRVVSSGTFATRSSVIRPEFGSSALLTFRQDGEAGAALLDLAKTDRQILAPFRSADTRAQPIAGSFASGRILMRVEDGPVTKLVINGPDRDIEADRLNTHLAGVQFATWQSISYTVEDPEGLLSPQVLESCVLLPAGHKPGVPLPLIVDVYPDIHSGCRDPGVSFDYADPHSPYLWAGKGYAYVQLAAPIDLIRTSEGPIAGLDDITDAGVRELVRAGIADPDRLILHGFSQGGVSALYVAAKSDLYAAVVVKNGWADLFSHYFGGGGVFAILYPEFLGSEAGRYDALVGTDFAIGRTPFDDPEVFYRNSPVFLARDINVPVLLMHSDLDIFSMSQFDEIFGALKRAGKNATYVRYWGEGHGPSSPANIRDMWRRIDLFLVGHGLEP